MNHKGAAAGRTLDWFPEARSPIATDSQKQKAGLRTGL
jgi:hypothetical protein